MYLFVYGIFKRGRTFPLEDDGARFVGEAVASDMGLFDIGGLAGMAYMAGLHTHGEVYEINDSILKLCDAVEGHPTFYERRMVDVCVDDASPDGHELKCHAYFYDRVHGRSLVPDGNW